jgi:NAD+ synthase (glutamine-hydrolysing)
MSPIRISCLPLNPHVGNLTLNLQKIGAAISQAKTCGAQLLVLPELALTGYPPEDLLLKSEFIHAAEGALDILAEMAGKELAVILGTVRAHQGHLYNAAVCLHAGKIVANYFKIELPNYGVFDEKRYFNPGEHPQIITLHGKNLALTVCEDIWIPNGHVEQQIRALAPDLVINIAASPFYAGKYKVREAILRRFATSSQTPVLYLNLLGGQDELVFDGGMVYMDAAGSTPKIWPRFQEKLFTLNWDGRGRATRASLPAPHLAVEIDLPLPVPDSSPVLDGPAAPTENPESMAEIYQALCLGLQDYTRKNGFTEVVIGLSGGIDSALTAGLAAAALGPEQVHVVSMPSPFSSPETREDARLIATNLGVSFRELPISNLMADYANELRPWIPGFESSLAFENIQARIRGNILMTLSNRFNWLVLTTGNKSELAVGYCTLYGDMAGGFSLIKDLTKTQVYAMALYLNTQADRNLIPESVIKRAPSAELRPDQRDQDSLPPYEMLDPIVEAYVEKDHGAQAIIAMGYESEMVRRVIRMMDTSEYKRRQAPPGIKITPKAFGRDRRLPITNGY